MKNGEFTYLYENNGRENRRLQLFTFRDEDGFFPSHLHFHTEYECMLITTGDVRVINNQLDLRVPSPCILLHKPYSYHVIHADTTSPYERYILYFSEEDLTHLRPVLTNHVPFMYNRDLCIYPIPAMELSTWEKLFAMFPTGDTAESIRLLFMGLILEKMTELNPLEMTESLKKRKYIQDVVQYINEHIAEPLSIDCLCELFYVSRSKLTRDFKIYTECTVHEYMMSQRLSMACRLLQSGKNVTQTSLECGFTNVSSFIRLFQDRFHLTPLQYGKKAVVTKL